MAFMKYLMKTETLGIGDSGRLLKESEMALQESFLRQRGNTK